MKLNIEALRIIMLVIQDSPMNVKDSYIIEKAIAQSDFEPEELNYALKQSIDAGLVDGSIHPTKLGNLIFIRDITPLGHQFIDSITTDKHWAKIKDYILDKGLPMTVPTVLSAIKSIFFNVNQF